MCVLFHFCFRANFMAFQSLANVLEYMLTLQICPVIEMLQQVEYAYHVVGPISYIIRLHGL